MEKIVSMREKASVPETETFCNTTRSIGSDTTYVDNLFRVFRHLHTQDKGIAKVIDAANVRRILFPHGGRPCAKHSVGQRDTLYSALTKSKETLECRG